MRQNAGPDHRNSSGRKAVLRGFRHPGRLEIVTSAGDMRPEASAEKQSDHSPFAPIFTASSQSAVNFGPDQGECFGNNACLLAMSVDSPLENTVNANPLRILRAAAPELSGIRVGWRCTTVGPCSTRVCMKNVETKVRLFSTQHHRVPRLFTWSLGLIQTPHPVRGRRLIPPPD